MLTHRWHTISESQFPWEQDALQYLRERLPDQEPVRAWANAEFLSLDGRMNEVDLIVLTVKGLFLVEIKSRPGEVTGDQQRWLWRDGASQFDIENPLRLANTKAKRLASLLAHQQVVGNARLPFIEAVVFCSAPGVRLKLPSPLDLRVFGREPGDGGAGTAPGILSALTDRAVGPQFHSTVDANMARIVARAMQQAGLRASLKAEQVGDYKLGALLGEGPSYQDYDAQHVSLHARRRVRLYPIPLGAPAETRQTIVRAAQREFQILEGVRHDGILHAEDYRETERGPALIFTHDPQAVRLDEFLVRHPARLDESLRLHLLREIAEVMRYAHARRLYHRALSPQSVFVTSPDSPEPGIRILNWQAGARHAGTTTGSAFSATQHIDELIDDASQVYVAPEARLGSDEYEGALDVFSLGAIAYHLFTGAPPADSLISLQDKLRTQGGLVLSDRLNGAPPSLLDLIKMATAPQVTSRIATVTDFLGLLELVEDELTRPEAPAEVNPVDAKKGDTLKGGLKVLGRMGKGATAVALLVERDGREFVFKVALSPEQNLRLRAEAEVLRKLRHQHIVAIHEEIETAGLVGLLLDKAGDATLAWRLREDGPLHLEWLQRFGDDLTGAVDWLEQQGIPHRDIKPENIGVTPVGRGDAQHLVLFDFSLSRETPENIRAGTVPYLDPFLKLRVPPRWDLHAERFAVAMTLHQMATGRLPHWGDGVSDPALIDAEVTLESELFDPGVRASLTTFFRRALARDAARRFDNAQEMREAWRKALVAAEHRPAAAVADPQPDVDVANVFEAALATATLDTPLPSLGLSTRAVNALERLGCDTVQQLVKQSLASVWGLPGVGHKTRKEIATVAGLLKTRFPNVASVVVPGTIESTAQSVDSLAGRLAPKKVSAPKGEERILLAWLGLDEAGLAAPVDPAAWPSQMDVAKQSGLTRARVSQVIVKARDRWRRDPMLTRMRRDLVTLIESHSSIMSAGEVASALLTLRGSLQDEPLRTRQAHAVARALVQVETAQQQSRLLIRRGGGTVFLALDEAVADWAESLGAIADRLVQREELPSPETALAALQELEAPEGVRLLAPARLLRLAAEASAGAAVSSRQELYPRGMAAGRALRLSQGLFASQKGFTVDQLRERVSSRYPRAESIPDRPALDELLTEAGFDVTWNADALDGKGGYRPREQYAMGVPSFSTSLTRLSTRPGVPLIVPDGDVLDARAFEERLRHAATSGQFLVLTTSPRDMQRAHQELLRFGAEPASVDALLIDAMKEAAAQAGASWDVVIRADASPHTSPEWRNLQILVQRAITPVKSALTSASGTRLVTNLGLLARYGQVQLFDDIRDSIGRPGGPKGLWLLVPGDDLTALPTIDGVPIPVITRAQWARIPEPWLRNVHRAA